MSQPLLTLGGNPDNPPLHIALANGFVPQTYLPLLRPFMDDYHVVSLPPRALWGIGDPPDLTPDMDWQLLATDLLAGFEQYDLQNIVAIGHSSGGVASLLALLQQPERFKALILLDPTILPPQICQALKAARDHDMIAEVPLVQAAKRRRRVFASVDDAYERFRGKQLFEQWSDEAMRLYAEYGTQPCAEGRCLTWSPEWEAFYFSTVYAEIWETLPQFAGIDVPLFFLAGGASDTYTPESAAKVSEILPDATHGTIDGHGHLFPQSAPEATAQAIQDWLGKL